MKSEEYKAEVIKSAEAAILSLNDLQSQMIGGKGRFGEIANIIQELLVRDQQWCDKWKAAVETNLNSHIAGMREAAEIAKGWGSHECYQNIAKTILERAASKEIK